MRFGVSWLAIVAVVALLYVLIGGLANPRTRPFVIGLGAIVGLVVMFLGFSRQATVQVHEPSRSGMTARTDQLQAIEVTPAPSRSKSSAVETKRPKMTFSAALRQAIVHALNTHDVKPIAEAPSSTAKTDVLDVSTREPARGAQPPDWVNAGPKMEGSSCTVSVCTGPFMTPLECERELPKKLQEVVADYAELSLGSEASAVRLPDDELQQLVRERWTEVRPMEIDGGSQEMVSLHAQVVFDARTQQRIKSEAQRVAIDRRVKGATVVFGGVLGLLALTWGGLKLATRRTGSTM